MRPYQVPIGCYRSSVECWREQHSEMATRPCLSRTLDAVARRPLAKLLAVTRCAWIPARIKMSGGSCRGCRQGAGAAQCHSLWQGPGDTMCLLLMLNWATWERTANDEAVVGWLSKVELPLCGNQKEKEREISRRWGDTGHCPAALSTACFFLARGIRGAGGGFATSIRDSQSRLPEPSNDWSHPTAPIKGLGCLLSPCQPHGILSALLKVSVLWIGHEEHLAGLLLFCGFQDG